MNDLAALRDSVQWLHLLRPQWLWALLALPVLVLWWRRRWQSRSAWRQLVDPHLLAHLIEPGANRRSRAGLVLAVFAYVLAVLALAGPSWRQSAQPLWESRRPLVVALDLSGTMRAGDLPPSRLAQARAKLATLLQARNGGPVALVVYAGDAFTVAPLTDDAANVALFLDALDPEIMPVDGMRGDRAIEHAVALLERAGASSGDIVLMTGQVEPAAIDAARKAAGAGFRVGALGLGTAEGAPFPTAEGALGHARLEADVLQRLASAGGGAYATLTADVADLETLGVLQATTQFDGRGKDGRNGMAWQDEGYWLLPPLMLLALFAFRRRSGVALVLLAGLCLPWMPAHAQGLWRRADQAAHAQLEKGNQAYRRGDYDEAEQRYASLKDATAQYNRGNALAKAGAYPEAIAAYDQALARQPGMPDALANKGAVMALMKRKSEGEGSGAGQQGQGQRGQQPGQPGQKDARTSAGKGEGEPDERRQSPPDARQPAKSPPASPPANADDTAQRAADRAQRERMQRALQQGKGKGADAKDPARTETAQDRERRLANEAWLRRVPDDPGGLLRTKFRLEYERRQAQGRAP
ncbi:VWA domain-containing protein [Agrilutibacter solisilvae]|uniref:VWA domain-containing protein n=1 Tax=Agrilutibacter solisilvae TaxID=2763317 RepID=A0A974Y147_9GAMM|nr:VWA domain-containing protein [Lysobacter solisilvae]QSX78633.1 VWA domain-containing protein [Lysobacter solisilvae]